MPDEVTRRVRQPRKIPRSEWATIASRHKAGESLASIARTYKCSAPAISYVVRQEQRAAPREAGRQSSLVGGDGSPPDDAARVMPSASAGVTGGNVTAIGAQSRRGPPRLEDFDFGLREAMMVEISAFLVEFDALARERSAAAFDRLRDATDALLRGAARTRIELERVRGK